MAAPVFRSLSDLRNTLITAILIVATWNLATSVLDHFLKGTPEVPERARDHMVRTQIETRGVKDATVLAAMRDVPRHVFVPPAYRSSAYEDHPLPIGEGQTISQPYIVAMMTETLALKRGEKVLEIGTGSGYQAAILATVGAEVYSIELLPHLADAAKTNLEDWGRSLVSPRNRELSPISLRTGDGYLGWPEAAPFDAVIVTCAPEEIPKPLVDQLREGGRMVIPVGPRGVQDLVLVRKVKGVMERESLIPVAFVPMVRPK